MPVKEAPHVSVVVPLYNEEESLPDLFRSLQAACNSLSQPYEIVFVDDGSQDGTYKILAGFHQSDRRVRVLRLAKNSGQTAAMEAGFRVARGKVIITMDGDLQNDPVDIPRIIEQLNAGFDIVCGWRKDRKDKLISRKIPSQIANWLIGKLTGVSIHDYGCSLKAYRADVIKRVPLYSEMHRFIPAVAALAGARVIEIPVTHHARQFGKSKYGLSRIWKVFSDLIVIKTLTGFVAHPSLLFGLLSFPAFLLGSGIVAHILIQASAGIVLPSLAILFFALAGHLMITGVLAEMIMHTGDYRPEQMLAHLRMQDQPLPDRA